jgi:hypothetical protein
MISQAPTVIAFASVAWHVQWRPKHLSPGKGFPICGHVTVCGQGALIKTFLSPEHVAIGEEVY